MTSSARGTTATAATSGWVDSTLSISTGIHVVAAADVHLLAAPDEAQPAAVVDPAEVAGAHEAVGGERGPRLFGIAPVARHDGGGAQAHLADLGAGDRLAVAVAERELDARVRAARR